MSEDKKNTFTLLHYYTSLISRGTEINVVQKRPQNVFPQEMPSIVFTLPSITGGCPTGYRERQGDVPGFGSLASHPGQTVLECSRLCDASSVCNSFEWSPTSNTCNLNAEWQPTEEAYLDYIYCSQYHNIDHNTGKALHTLAQKGHIAEGPGIDLISLI